MIRAGQLRHHITLQKPLLTKDAYGQDKQTWADVVSLRANIQTVFGPQNRETYLDDQVGNKTVFKIQIRWRSDVQPSWRVSHEDKLYEIDAILDPDQRRRELLLMCRIHE